MGRHLLVIAKHSIIADCDIDGGKGSPKQTMKKNYLLAAVIGGAFAVLMAIFAAGLKNDPNALDLVVKGEKIPEFTLPDLLADGKMLTNADWGGDKAYYLVNFWGSWCPSCYQEHPYLMQLSQTETIYGVNWKDERSGALGFLQKGGNPFAKIVVDNTSILAIGMGVYGAPETFLIAGDGTIIYRHAGAMSSDVWQRDFLPKIKGLK